jgi:4-hydroxy-2-oxoheptanedioate aldolase
MSSLHSLGDRLKSGGPIFSAWCGLLEPGIAGLLAREPFDAVTLDMQHGAIDFATLVRAVPLVAAAGKPAIARIPVGDFATASRLLDSGVSAIIAPMINTVEDARRLGSFTKFPPLGARSWGPHAALALSGLSPIDYLAQANGFSIALAMIETREALGIVDDILTAPGIDGIFIGPADLSIALSNGGIVDPASAEVEKALDHVLARARAANRFAAIYAPTGERAAVLARRGFDLIAAGSDSAYLRTGAGQALAAAKASAKSA